MTPHNPYNILYEYVELNIEEKRSPYNFRLLMNPRKKLYLRWEVLDVDWDLSKYICHRERRLFPRRSDHDNTLYLGTAPKHFQGRQSFFYGKYYCFKLKNNVIIKPRNKILVPK